MGHFELSEEELRQVLIIIEEVCQRHGTTRADLPTRDAETNLLILEEVHWRVIQVLADQTEVHHRYHITSVEES